MKSRKYPTFEDAISYLESKGTLTYWGWVGQTEGYYVYTYLFEGMKYHLAIFKDGKVEIKGYSGRHCIKRIRSDRRKIKGGNLMIEVNLKCDGKVLFEYYSTIIPRANELMQLNVDDVIGKYRVREITHQVFRGKKDNAILTYVTVELLRMTFQD